jgi:hypothetical protein
MNVTPDVSLADSPGEEPVAEPIMRIKKRVEIAMCSIRALSSISRSRPVF